MTGWIIAGGVGAFIVLAVLWWLGAPIGRGQ